MSFASKIDRRACLLVKVLATTFFATLVLARESEKLDELDLLSMPHIQLVLATDAEQSLMIQVEYKRLGLEVMIPML